MSALDKQVGGNHYKNFEIQPVEFIQKNDLGFCLGNIVKYSCRYKQKKIPQDLEKVIHYAQILLNFDMRNSLGKFKRRVKNGSTK